MEHLKPHSDNPIASKESFELLMAVAANNRFMIDAVVIRATFLQSKVLDCDVFVKHPEYIRKPGVISKLKKPLYVLDVPRRKF